MCIRNANTLLGNATPSLATAKLHAMLGSHARQDMNQPQVALKHHQKQLEQFKQYYQTHNGNTQNGENLDNANDQDIANSLWNIGLA